MQRRTPWVGLFVVSVIGPAYAAPGEPISPQLASATSWLARAKLDAPVAHAPPSSSSSAATQAKTDPKSGENEKGDPASDENKSADADEQRTPGAAENQADEAEGDTAQSDEANEADEAATGQAAGEAPPLEDEPAAAGEPAAPFGWYIGLGAGVYFDDATIDSSERRRVGAAQDTVEDEFGIDNDNKLAIYLDVHRPLTSRLRVGGALRYSFNYEYTRDDDDDEEPEIFRLGQLFELLARGDFAIPLGNIDVSLGAQAGVAVLIPDGVLQDDIDAFQDQNIDVWNAPRWGVLGGPHVGVRYALSDRVALRAEAALLWEHLILFWTEDEVQGVEVEIDRDLSARRLLFTGGLEFGL